MDFLHQFIWCEQVSNSDQKFFLHGTSCCARLHTAYCALCCILCITLHNAFITALFHEKSLSGMLQSEELAFPLL